MKGNIRSFSHSLLTKVIVTVSATLLVCIAAWSIFSLHFQESHVTDTIVEGEERLSNTIRLALHYAMLHNSRDDIRHIVRNVGKQRDVEDIRIYDKSGAIQFSSKYREVGSTTNIKAEACDVCHRQQPPLTRISLEQRTRTFSGTDGVRYMGVLTPIYNEPTCSTQPCHFHPPDKEVLGALDIVVSLEKTDAKLFDFKIKSLGMAAFAFLATSWIILVFVLRFVREPIKNLMAGTRLIAEGKQIPMDDMDHEDEMGQLVYSINRMGREIGRKQDALNRQREEFQGLFENVPCLITVQDKNYRLLRYNRMFGDRFAPLPGAHCYEAYKGRDTKCEHCPVEGTFADGLSRCSEESGYLQDGTEAHWLVTTQPIFNDEGEVTAVMELCLDISQRKTLEKELEKSEKKYHDIFNTIPNPVFVLEAETLAIVDCNHRVEDIYGWRPAEFAGKNFLDLSRTNETDQAAQRIKTSRYIPQAKHSTKDGQRIYVDIMISPSEYMGRKVLLATISDITNRLETEQQLIQASKMATLGEMSTGVAHELNQPLSVIRTISGYFMRKLRKKEPIEESTFISMAQGIDSNVERAAKIIDHMREFGHKPGASSQAVSVNDVMNRAFDIFDQQLKLRNIRVDWQTATDLPPILAEPNRLEQVFINLLINARDSIDERWEEHPELTEEKCVLLRTALEEGRVIVEIADNGSGFPEEIADKLFEPFFTTKEVGKGTGLGLSISYGIVTDYAGTIRARTAPGGGASFIMSFPEATQEDLAKAQSRGINSDS